MKFTPNQPFETDSPTVDVDPGLAPGLYRFRLIVSNDRGKRSQPAHVNVRILERPMVGPVGPLDPRREIPVTPVRPPVPITPVAPIPPIPRRPGRPGDDG